MSTPAPPADELVFFHRMRDAVSAAFDKSPVRRKQKARGEQWMWNVCALPLRRQADLLLGLNWGWRKSHGPYRPWTKPPSTEQVAGVWNYNFIKRSLPLLQQFGFDLARMNYFNVCPFRSPSIGDLEDEDWRLAVEHFFLDAMAHLAPPRTLILGTTAVDRLEALHLVAPHVEWESCKDGDHRVWGARGQIMGRRGHRHPFVAVPHPNARIGESARRNIWRAVLG